MSERGCHVIVVGGRCAGSPTAMLPARRGHRALLVDKATFPSDTMSTHLVHPPGIASLERWRLLDKLVASGCPPVRTYTVDRTDQLLQLGRRRQELGELVGELVDRSGVAVARLQAAVPRSGHPFGRVEAWPPDAPS